MTDERIKEEFDAYMVKKIPIDIVQKAVEFSNQYASAEDELFQKIAYYQAMGFISGSRAAERLAKIEVLEEVRDYVINSIDPFARIDEMLSELKADQ